MENLGSIFLQPTNYQLHNINHHVRHAGKQIIIQVSSSSRAGSTVRDFFTLHVNGSAAVLMTLIHALVVLGLLLTTS